MSSDPTQKYVKELQSKLSKQKLFVTTDRLMFQDSDTIGAGFFSTIFLGQLKSSDMHASDETTQVAIKKVSSKSSLSMVLICLRIISESDDIIVVELNSEVECYGIPDYTHVLVIT